MSEPEITLSSPGGDDDGRLMLDYTIDETVISDRGSGVVTGLRSDPIPAPRADVKVVRCTEYQCGSTCDADVLLTANWTAYAGGWRCPGHVPL